ncbi:hypothetical protein TNCV_1605831 [Trichonephila clavipes]|nr:hypothetical protein TNCV_1605831 [Trichonephila clavipes]
MVTGDDKYGSRTTILCENDRGQSAVKQLKRGPNQDYQPGRCLLSTTGPFEASYWPELANRRGVVFHQDNARPYTFVVTRQKLWELGWEVLMHPP